MSWTRVPNSRSNCWIVSPSTPLAPCRLSCRQVSSKNSGVSRWASEVKRSLRSVLALALICPSCVDIRSLPLGARDVSPGQSLDLPRRFPLRTALPCSSLHSRYGPDVALSTLSPCRCLHEPKTRFPVEWLVLLAGAGVAPPGNARLILAHRSRRTSPRPLLPCAPCSAASEPSPPHPPRCTPSDTHTAPAAGRPRRSAPRPAPPPSAPRDLGWSGSPAAGSIHLAWECRPAAPPAGDTFSP